jgi:hypothetical protein
MRRVGGLVHVRAWFRHDDGIGWWVGKEIKGRVTALCDERDGWRRVQCGD